MAAWGNRSSSPLLKRLSESRSSSNPIKSVTVLPMKTWSSSNEDALLGMLDMLEEVNCSGKATYSLSKWGESLGKEGCAVKSLKFGTERLSSSGLSAVLEAMPRPNESVVLLDLSNKGLKSVDLALLKAEFVALGRLDCSRNGGIKLARSGAQFEFLDLRSVTMAGGVRVWFICLLLLHLGSVPHYSLPLPSVCLTNL